MLNLNVTLQQHIERLDQHIDQDWRLHKLEHWYVRQYRNILDDGQRVLANHSNLSFVFTRVYDLFKKAA